MLLLTSQLARKSMQLVYFSTWNTASGRSACACNIGIALQARGCWKWQGSILDPFSKTMDRLPGKWEEDSTNCWTRMEENRTIWQGSKYNPTPTPCYYIRGDSAFGYCTKIFNSDMQTDILTKWVMHAILISCSLWLIIFTIIDTRIVGVALVQARWGGVGIGGPISAIG